MYLVGTRKTDTELKISICLEGARKDFAGAKRVKNPF